jgi:hypothetical protein
MIVLLISPHPGFPVCGLFSFTTSIYSEVKKINVPVASFSHLVKQKNNEKIASYRSHDPA